MFCPTDEISISLGSSIPPICASLAIEDVNAEFNRIVGGIDIETEIDATQKLMLRNFLRAVHGIRSGGPAFRYQLLSMRIQCFYLMLLTHNATAEPEVSTGSYSFLQDYLSPSSNFVSDVASLALSCLEENASLLVASNSIDLLHALVSMCIFRDKKLSRFSNHIFSQLGITAKASASESALPQDSVWLNIFISSLAVIDCEKTIDLNDDQFSLTPIQHRLGSVSLSFLSACLSVREFKLTGESEVFSTLLNYIMRVCSCHNNASAKSIRDCLCIAATAVKHINTSKNLFNF